VTRRLPQALKFAGTTNKVLLRRLLDKYLPGEIVQKGKGYFAFPIEHVLAEENHSYLDRYLSEASLRKHGLVHPRVADSYIRRYRNGDRSVQGRVWALLLLSMWLEEVPAS
jgi:asparagine synthase (glutamine-hydrolysing)